MHRLTALNWDYSGCICHKDSIVILPGPLLIFYYSSLDEEAWHKICQEIISIHKKTERAYERRRRAFLFRLIFVALIAILVLMGGVYCMWKVWVNVKKQDICIVYDTCRVAYSFYPKYWDSRHKKLGEWLEYWNKLKWESLKKKRRERESRLILLYKGLKGVASIPTGSIPTDDLIPPIRRSRNHHPLTFQTPAARIDIYKGSFFPQTIRDWNALSDSIITSVEGAEDGVARFTSLMRGRY